MFKTAMIALVLTMGFAASPALTADEELSPELRVLDQRVGTWKIENVVKPGVWVPEGAKTTGIETIEWTLGRKFIKGEAKFENSQGKGTNMHLMTYDPHERVYQFWYFDSNGEFPRSEMKGTYDEKLNTITYKSALPNDVSVVVAMRFDSKDRLTWHGQWKDKDGQLMMEIEGKVTRVTKDGDKE